MAEADMVARYYQDASAAVTDLRTMIDEFEDLFTLDGYFGTDEPTEPYRYSVVKGCGNLAGGALAKSIRQFVRAVARVEEYVSTDRSARVDLKLHEEFSKRAFASLYRSARVDLKLLEEWACEIAFTFSNAKSSEKLVDLFIRVRQAFWTFAEEVECDSRVAINSSPKKPKNPRKPKLNSLMVDLLKKHRLETCVSWSIESWAIQLVPQWGSKRLKSSIVKTETWKWISGLRKQPGTDLTDHQTADDESGLTTMPSVGLLPSSESSPAAPETERQDSKADDESDPTTIPIAETSALRNQVESVPEAVVVRNTMRQLTKGWRIEYGNEARDVELVGFDYIATLVNAAGNEVSTDRLLGNENEPALANDRHSPQPRWDDLTRNAVENRIQKLEADIERFNIECIEAKEENNDLDFAESNEARTKAFDEVNELRAQKREAIGKSGRTRELNRPNRKGHDNVRKRIDGAREHLKAKKLLKLHQHFVEFIQPNGKGSAYIYCPEPKVEWTVIFHVE